MRRRKPKRIQFVALARVLFCGCASHRPPQCVDRGSTLVNGARGRMIEAVRIASPTPEPDRHEAETARKAAQEGKQ